MTSADMKAAIAKGGVIGLFYGLFSVLLAMKNILEMGFYLGGSVLPVWDGKRDSKMDIRASFVCRDALLRLSFCCSFCFLFV